MAWISLSSDGTKRTPPARGEVAAPRDPDQTFLRLLTLPEGGIQAIEMNRDAAEAEGPWIAPDIMKHP
jgi:hypothetical protein